MPHDSLWALQADTAEDVLRDLRHELSAHCNPPQAFLVSGRAETPPAPLYDLRDGVAVISVEGVIDRAARLSFFTGLPYTAGQDRIRSGIEAALNDPAVQAILLSLNSPGGLVAGTRELADFIAEAAGRKPCAAYADGLCASAAYWLASATGRVYAPLTAQVGSIGVIAVLTDWSKAAEKAGVVRTVLTGGKWKAAGSPDKPLTDEERELFQRRLAGLHAIFRQDVAARMTIAAPTEAWAEGQTLLAADARAVGLVTAIVQDRDAAIAALKAPLKENRMDVNERKAGHPDIVEAPAKENAAGAHKAGEEAAAQARAEMLALVKAVAGEETAARVERLAQAGVTPAQLAALAPLLTTPSAGPAGRAAARDSEDGAAGKEAAARQQMLEAITSATGGPLASGAEVRN
ncbi:MAG: S49 family peptidase, partial [Desulfovibrionaceae bacterium]|nr:S49 family peptidase [Desulfovibrionaceae bacterium]